MSLRASAEPLSHAVLPVAGSAKTLALVFQEFFTVIVRLRSGRHSVGSADSFRNTVQGVLKRAESEALSHGYSADDVKLARFAAVAFLDESVLNSRNQIFAEWARKPLQVELFGVGDAGEIFFQTLDKLLARQDSAHLAELLDVYYLCLLLGYRGRYSMSGSDGLHPVLDSVAEKIRRIRGTAQPLSKAWMRSTDPVQASGGDPWFRKLLYATTGCVVLALALYLLFNSSINGAISDLHEIATQSSP